MRTGAQTYPCLMTDQPNSQQDWQLMDFFKPQQVGLGPQSGRRAPQGRRHDCTARQLRQTALGRTAGRQQSESRSAPRGVARHTGGGHESVAADSCGGSTTTTLWSSASTRHALGAAHPKACTPPASGSGRVNAHCSCSVRGLAMSKYVSVARAANAAFLGSSAQHTASAMLGMQSRLNQHLM
jgi:hypothetical protein